MLCSYAVFNYVTYKSIDHNAWTFILNDLCARMKLDDYLQ